MENYTGKLLDDRYEMQEIIGIGGMAVVYKAYDNIDDRIVAVKILKDEFLANDDFRRRFKNESKAIAVLSHPNIVKVYDVSFGEKLQYIVMEYVDGITLKEYIEQTGIISPEDTVYFITQILLALQHAHDKGIIHRDIKPQNIMLLENGNIKVTDFGIARFSRSESRTLSEKAIGSVHYISPEQAKGEITDEKSDIYSVGVMMYEMLTGQLPFQAENPVSVAIMQLQSEPKRPSILNPAIPLGLEQITIKAMRKNVSERYQSAGDFLYDLQRFSENPNIRFPYTYFVDNEPTKYFEAVRDPSETKTELPPIDGEIPEDQLEPEPSKTIKILTITAISVAAVLLIAGILWMTGAFGGGDSIVCPNFVGKNYAEEIENNPEYDMYEFVIESYESSEEYEEGVVCDQLPEAGTKIKNYKITLVISTGMSDGEMIEVPDIYNQDLTTARELLKQSGITNFDTFDEASETVEAGKIIRTDPEIGSEISSTEKLKIYISTGSEVELKKMPSIINMSKDDAVKQLEKFGFTIGKTTEADSTLPKGYVIEQSIDEGTEVEVGTAVDVVVSNGKAPTSSVTITFTLPNVTNTSGYMQVYIDNVEDSSKAATVRLTGNKQSISLTGNSASCFVIVTIDDQTYYTATVNFRDGTVSNEKTYNFVAKKAVDNVLGQTESEATSTLESSGFKVVVERVPSDSEKGKVISQTPGSGEYIEVGSTVTITVSNGPAE